MLKYRYLISCVVLVFIALATFFCPLGALGQTIESFNFNVGADIPDGNPNGLIDSQTITSSILSLANVDVVLTLSGQSGGGFLGDLYIALQHSGGYSVLLNRVGRGSALSSGYSDGSLDVTFDDSAAAGDIHRYRAVLAPSQTGALLTNITGSWQPDARYVDPSVALDSTPRARMLDQMNGRAGSGTWSLLVVDLISGNTTRLERWGLRLSGTSASSFTVGTSVSGLGQISLSPAQITYSSGTIVQATAVASAGYGFERWTAGASGTNPTATFTVTSNTIVSGSFKLIRSLALLTNGVGSASVTPLGTNFLDGTTVSVQAVPGLNQAFVGWTGDLAGALNPASVVMTTNKSITANFVSVYQLSATAQAGGSLAWSPAGTNFNSGTVVTFTATASPGYAFTGWSGNMGGLQNPAALAMTSNKSVTANFVRVYQLAASAQAGGSVAWSPTGTNFNSGSVITLTATPAAGYAFSGWTGDLTGTLNPAAVVMGTNKVITANFVRVYQLAASALAGGSVSWSPAGTNFNSGAIVNLTATPAAGYAFSGWTGDLTGTLNPALVVMGTNKNITATFVSVYQLAATAQTGGSVSWSPSGTNFNSGTTVALTATPAAGYAFSGWSGDLAGMLNPASLVMTANRTVTANFVRVYQLSASSLAGGSVSWSPTGTTFNSGATVSVTATPAAGYVFTGWTGDLTGTPNPVAVVMNTNKTFTANFALLSPLTLSSTVGGSVSSSPGGTNFAPGTLVALTATTNLGYAFTGWSGDLVGTQNPATVSMNAGKVITANFLPIYQLTLPVPVGGLVTSSPSATNLISGSTVTLTATPSAGYAFTGWSGDASGIQNPASVVMTSNKSISANFVSVYQLSAVAQAGGSLAWSPTGTNFNSGSTVTLTATPLAGYAFSGWSGDLTGVQNPAAVVMTTNKNVTANFVSVYQLAAAAQTGGTLSWSPVGTNFNAGATVTLTATPLAGYAFTGWSGSLSGLQNPAALAMTSNKSVTANFVRIYQLAATVQPGGSVVWSPTGTNFNSGSIVTLTASPAAGYAFSGWSGDISGTLNPASVVMSTNRSVMANFVPVYQLAATALTGGTVAWSPTGTSFNSGAGVTLTATPAAGYSFSGWTGDLTGTQNPASVVMTANKNITANFALFSTLSLTSTVGGSVSSNPGGTNFVPGTSVVLTATTNAGYVFAGWSGDLVGTVNPVTVSMTASKAIAANFLPVYQLSLPASLGGSVGTSPSGTNFVSGSSVTLTATPAAGYSFAGWGGDASGTQNPATVLMTGSKVITASFTSLYQLSANAQTGGSVAWSPGGTNFVPGTTVTLTATPAAGYSFTGWAGDLTGTLNPATLSMTASKVLTATFAPLYQLNLSASAGGSVAALPVGSSFVSGSAVTLTASSSTGYAFVGWTGDLAGTANPATITMSSNRTISANFKPLRTVAVTAYGPGQVIPNGGSFPDGTILTLEARPNPGNAMWFWFGNAYGSSTNYTFTVSSNVSIGAYFVPLYNLTVSNSVGGTVVATADGLPITNNLTSKFRSYSSIALKATPSAGYTFQTWTGTFTNVNASSSFSLMADASVRPVFAPIVTALGAQIHKSELLVGQPLTISLEGGLMRLDWPDDGSRTLHLLQSSDFQHWLRATTSPPPFYPSLPREEVRFYRIEAEDKASGAVR